MAQAQLNELTMFEDEVSSRFHETINENASWTQKQSGRGVKFITSSDGDWKTQCNGFLIKHNETLVALSIEDVLDSSMFTETLVPTSKGVNARIFKSKSINFDFYPKDLERAEKFLDAMEFIQTDESAPESKGDVVRQKRRKLDDGTEQVLNEQNPFVQSIQPLEPFPMTKRKPRRGRRSYKKKPLLGVHIPPRPQGVVFEPFPETSLEDLNKFPTPLDLGEIANLCDITG